MAKCINCNDKWQNERNATIMDRWEHHGEISIGMVFVLADMARNGVIPNGNFSDDECNIWMEFRNMMK